MAYEYFKDLPRKIASDKVFHDIVFSIPKNMIYGEYALGYGISSMGCWSCRYAFNK